jgi:hypothetical protein
MDFGGRYGSFLAAVGSAVLALTYGTSVMISNNVLLKKGLKHMRALYSKDLEKMGALSGEKIKSAKAEAEDKIKTANAEAANQVINDYLRIALFR